MAKIEPQNMSKIDSFSEVFDLQDRQISIGTVSKESEVIYELYKNIQTDSITDLSLPKRK